VVLDPFMGSGSAAVAAVRTGRHYLGYDTDPVYVEAARARAADEALRVAAAGGPVAVSGPAAGLGDKAVEAAAALLAKAGFAVDPRGRRRPGGLEVPLVATDAGGHEWLVDVVGGFTLARPGLRRSDVLERTLGRAARLSAFGEHRLLVLATDVPDRGSPGAAALRAARGRVFVDVLPIDLPEPTIDRLAAYAGAVPPPAAGAAPAIPVPPARRGRPPSGAATGAGPVVAPIGDLIPGG
jgi:hypothetical protein